MKHTFEIGRSMVEMLGVLAIIGILSIGAIAGYNYALAKYRANETINDIMLRRTELIRQQTTLSIPTLADWNDDATIYPMELVKMEETVNGQQNTAYGIGVSGVHSKTCQIIAEDLSSHAQIIINGYQYNGTFNNSFCNIAEQNDMDFYFIPNAECINDSDCDAYGCSACINGMCDPTLQEGKKCGKNLDNYHTYGTCQSGECIYEDCGWTGWFNSGKPDYSKLGGDYELIEEFNLEGEVKSIWCRVKGFPATPVNELGQHVTCDPDIGLVCNNIEQVPGGATHIPVCADYEVSFYTCIVKPLGENAMTRGDECLDEEECCFNGLKQTDEPCTTEDGKLGWCYGECREVECRDNNDCSTGEYCDTNCGHTCVSLPTMTSYTILGKTYYLSDEQVEGYGNTNENLCSAFGKQQGEPMKSITAEEIKRNDYELPMELEKIGITSLIHAGGWAGSDCLMPGQKLYTCSNTLGGCGYEKLSVLCHNPNE